MKTYSNITETNTNHNRFNMAQNTRADIIGELDAILQYENHIANSNDPLVIETLKDIVDEEKLHVGQLFGMLFYLDAESQKQFEKGLNEFYKDSNINN